MNTLKRKLNRQGGFTLVEMLVVVAIIAILVAVSIPIVGNALERTKHATDAANERAAKAEILLRYLSDDGDDTVPDANKVKAGTTYYYDAANGKIVANSTTSITAYGKHKKEGTGGFDHTKEIVAVKISAETATKGDVLIAWVTAGTANTDITASDSDLCSIQSKIDHTT